MAFRSASTFFVSAPSSASARFTAAVRVVSFEHQLGTLSSAAFISVCAISFFLDGVVFLVGLDGHRLLAELRRAALVEGDVFSTVRRAFWLSASCSLAAATCSRAAGSDWYRRLLELGLFCETAFGGVGGGVEPLENDQSFEIGIHKQKSPGASAPGSVGPVMTGF